MSEKIVKLVCESVEHVNQMLINKAPISQGKECSLFGEFGVLDSMALVSLIVDVEERIEKQFGVTLILANEKAMSQKRSPFLTVGTLSNYVASLIQEARHG